MKKSLIKFEQTIKQMIKSGEIIIPKEKPLRKEFKERMLKCIERAMEKYNNENT